MAALAVNLLGILQVTLDREAITHFESIKVRALLAYLAAEAGHPQQRSMLAGLLWPEWPEEAAQKNLRHTLYSLRKVLHDPACLEADRQSIVLVTGNDCQVDVIELQEALTNMHQPQVDSAVVNRLTSVVGNWRGRVLDGFMMDDSPAFESWILNQSEYYSQQIMEGLSLLADWYEREGEYKQAEEFGRKQLMIEPWREDAHLGVMLALAKQGKRSQALAQYEACKNALQEEFGVKPGKKIVKLFEQIQAGVFQIEAETKEPYPINPGRNLRHNLPSPLTRFIGKVNALQQLKKLLANHRLVTIT